MTFMDSATPITHFCRNLTEFHSDRADLRNGVTYSTSSFSDESDIAEDLFEFGMWFSLQIYPRLNGFQGCDCVKFTKTS